MRFLNQLRGLFQNTTGTRRSRKKRNELETLESRQLLTARVIDFNALPFNSGIGFRHVEDGFHVEHVGGNGLRTHFSNWAATNGTTAYNNSVNAFTTVYRADGGNFQFQSIDLNSLNANQSAVVPFTTTLAAGGSGSFSFTTDSTFSSFQTFNATPAILASFRWQQIDPGGPSTDFHQFDNISLLVGPSVLSIGAELPGATTTAVDVVSVTLDEAADLATFDFNDLTLTRDGSPVTLNASVTVSHTTGNVYSVQGLAAFTAADGQYSLAVNARNIRNASGLDGIGTGSVTWQKTLPPTVVGTTPSFATSGTLPAGTSSLVVTFDRPVADVGVDGNNFDLRTEGPDGLLGTADDVVVPLTVTNGTGFGQLNFDPLPEGIYRLSVRDSITDPNGIALDGDANGAAGGNWIRDFVVVAQQVALDQSFGSGGLITSPIGPSNDVVRGVVLQSDGKIVVAGNSTSGSGNDDFALARYNADGSLDSTFGSGGKVTTAIGSLNDYANALALQGDGKIIVVGRASNGTNDDFAVARYLPNGQLDLTFGSGGKLTTAVGASDERAFSVAVQNDGRILVAGYTRVGSTDDFAIVKYLSNGSLDTSFGIGGKVTTAIGAGHDGIHSMVVQSDGRILVGGYAHNGSNYDFALARYLSNGNLDTTFGSGGKRTTNLGPGDDIGYRLAVQNDGRIVVVGNAFNGANLDFAVARYLANGNLDTTFGTAGTLSTSFGSSNETANAVVIQSDGRIVVAGRSFNGSNDDFAISRYNSDGSLDSSFNGDGKLTHGVGSSTEGITGLEIQSDGRIIAAGYSSNGTDHDFALARYTATGTYDRDSANGVTFDVDHTGLGSGQLVHGTGGTFDGLNRLEINGALYAPTPTISTGVVLSDDGRTISTPPQIMSGLSVSREVTIPNVGSEDFARTVEVLFNPTASSITVPVRMVGNVGSDAATTVFATSDGDLIVEPTDLWFGTDDGDGTGTPAVIHLLHGPFGLQPSSVNVIGDNVDWTYDLTVPAGETKRLATFTVLGTTRAEAIAAANALVTYNEFGGEAAAFLTQPELDSLANFQFNSAPTDTQLSDSVVPENAAVGTVVGTFTSTDPDSGSTFVYSLVSGDGDSGNGSFAIEGDVLKTNAVFDFETQDSYSIRVRSTDQGGLSVEKIFMISITWVDTESPTVVDASFVASGTLPVAAQSLAITFSEPVVGATVPGNYELRRAGADGLLGTADDPIVTITSATLTGNTTTLHFSELPEDVYRLVTKDEILDLNGNALDGDSDGVAGADNRLDFVVSDIGDGSPVTLLPQGVGSAEWFGSGVAVSKDRVVVASSSAGQVSGGQIFVYASDSLTPLFNLANPFGPDFGDPVVAVSDDYIVVGNILKSNVVYLFNAVTGAFVSQLMNPNPSFADRFGHTVAVAGDRVVVGAYNHSSSGPGSGIAYLFDASTGNVVSSLSLPDAAASDGFGRSVSISKDRVVVGTNERGAGVFDANTGSFVGRILNPNPSSADNFGWSVAISGDTIAIGAPSKRVGGVTVGGAYLFSADSLELRYSLTAPDAAAGDFFGGSISISNNSVVVGARGDDDGGFDSGSVYVFDVSTGELFTKITNPTPASGELFGDRVAVSGNRIVSGAYSDTTLGPQVGAAYVVSFDTVHSLASGSGRNFDISTAAIGSGQLLHGTDNAFDGLNRLQVAGVDFAPLSAPLPVISDNGRTVITSSITTSSLDVQREITVPNAGLEDFARTVDVFTNPTGNEITVPVRLVGNLGSGSATTVFATSDGDLIVEPTDTWFGTDDGDGTGAPAVIHLLRDPSGIAPSNISVIGDNVEWTFDLTVRAGETKRLATFTVVGTTRAEAIAAANALVTYNGFGGEAAAFLTQSELDSLANFQFNSNPTDIGLSNATVSENAAFGTVVGTFTSVDPDAGGTFNYSLVSGDGDSGNGSFVIDGDMLKTNSVFDFETQDSYSIRVRSTDQGGLSFEKIFTISVTNVTELGSIDVQLGLNQRSYVRYLDAVFDRPDELQDLLNNNRLQLNRYDLNGANGSTIPLPAYSISGNTIRFDFGVQGIGGNRNSNIGDGYYQLVFDEDGDGQFAIGSPVKSFHRLLGDVNGDGRVDAADKSQVLLANRTTNAESDANGDGIVNLTDVSLVSRAFGRKLKDDLFTDD